MLYLEAEALLDDSAATLAEITEYLGLAASLTESYERFPMTGRAKFGDSSPWISAGTIVRERGSEKIEVLGSSRMAALWQAYDDFRRYAHANAESAILRKAGISRRSGARGRKGQSA